MSPKSKGASVPPVKIPPSAPSGELGPLLRHWRDVRGKSQLDLSIDTGVSQRHISFVESGRSVPSRPMLLTVALALDVPLRERNRLLLAAGYAPVYAESAWDGPEMASINNALQRMLRQHEPFPAVVMDRYWNVLATNDAAPRFFNCFIDLAARTKPRNILHLMFDPEGMRPFINDWDAAANGLMERVYRESIGRVIDAQTRDLLDALLAYAGVKGEWKAPDVGADLPMIPLGFVKDGTVLNYFSLITTVGTPRTIAAQELRLECMFPADEATERAHVALMRAAQAVDLPAGH